MGEVASATRLQVVLFQAPEVAFVEWEVSIETYIYRNYGFLVSKGCAPNTCGSHVPSRNEFTEGGKLK